MAVQAVIEQVRVALEQLGTDCSLEEIVGLCPELTWNQIFLAVDHLSRTDQVRVTLDPGRTYRIRLNHATGSERSYITTGQTG
jgi:hypothetical protein